MSSAPESSSAREERVNEAIAAYLEAAEAGRAPGRDEFLARYPDLADDVRAFLDDRDRFARAVAPLGPPPPAAVPEAPTRTPGGPPAADPALGLVRYFGDSATTSCWRRSPAAAWAWSTGRGRCRSTAPSP
jgi:hypothetical protein